MYTKVVACEAVGLERQSSGFGLCEFGDIVDKTGRSVSPISPVGVVDVDLSIRLPGVDDGYFSGEPPLSAGVFGELPYRPVVDARCSFKKFHDSLVLYDVFSYLDQGQKGVYCASGAQGSVSVLTVEGQEFLFKRALDRGRLPKEELDFYGVYSRLEHKPVHVVPMFLRGAEVMCMPRLPIVLSSFDALLQVDELTPYETKLRILAVCSIMLQLISAIEELYVNGIAHQDIKPHNMGLTSEGLLQLFDFGKMGQIGESSVEGTIPMTAPNAFHRSPSDGTQDLWSALMSGLMMCGISMENLPQACGRESVAIMFFLGMMLHDPSLWDRMDFAKSIESTGLDDTRDASFCAHSSESLAQLLALMRSGQPVNIVGEVIPALRAKFEGHSQSTINSIQQMAIPADQEEVEVLTPLAALQFFVVRQLASFTSV